MPRKRRSKTEFEKDRDKYRDASPRHVVTFEADMDEDMKRHAFAYANDLRMLGNNAVGILNKRIDQLFRTKEYRALQKDYGWHVRHMDGLEEDSDRYKTLSEELDAIGAKMTAMQEQYGLTEKSVYELTRDKASAFGVGSIFGLTRGEDIWAGCEKVLFEDGHRLHFRKRGDLPIIRAKQSCRGIVIGSDDDGCLQFYLDGVGEFGVQIPADDLFLKDESAKILEFLENPGQEAECINHMVQSGEVVPVFRPCFASLKCETIRGRLRVYVQVTIADVACSKKKKDGSPRHDFSKKGRIGCDNGTQSYAAVADQQIILDNLAERNHQSTKRSERIIRNRQRHMEASKRKMNPERFNANGTYKKGSRGRWKKSKKYRRLEYLNHERMRRDALTRKYAIQTDANRLRSLGDEIIIEPSNAKALQKKAKASKEKSDKAILVQKKDGTAKMVQKNKRRKRFGKSLQYRCPGAFQAELKKKFGKGYHEVSSRKFRASQYDHMLGECIKKKLSQRWHELPDGRRIQRDVYSAFLMYCSNEDFTAPDQELCIRKFDKFYERHERLIQSIINEHLKICNSGIKV